MVLQKRGTPEARHLSKVKNWICVECGHLLDDSEVSSRIKGDEYCPSCGKIWSYVKVNGHPKK